MTSALPVKCSTNRAIKPNKSRSFFIRNLKIVLMLCVEFSQGYDEGYLALCAGLRQCIWTLCDVNSQFKLNSVLLFSELCNNRFIWFTMTKILSTTSAVPYFQ